MRQLIICIYYFTSIVCAQYTKQMLHLVLDVKFLQSPPLMGMHVFVGTRTDSTYVSQASSDLRLGTHAD